MKLELFYAPGCSACNDEREKLKAAALEAIGDLDWREFNVVDEIDHALERGVLTVPAVVIDGTLVFSSLPTPRQLRNALLRRATRRR